MRVLLDECIDQRLARDLPQHQVDHVRRLGWASLDDGDLLRRASDTHGVFVTVDRGIPFQRSIAELEIAVIVVRVKRNTRSSIVQLLPKLLREIEGSTPGQVAWVDED